MIARIRGHAEELRSSERHPWFTLGAVMLGTIMGPLDGSIANIALPTIATSYHENIVHTEWVLLAYMLVTASTLVIFGRLGDLFGQKRIYLGGFAVFAAGSLACTVAPSLSMLIAARVVQGFGAAMLMASAPAIIVHTFPAAIRGRAIGLNGAAVAIGLLAGPLLGGLILHSASWRWIFAINLPISVVAFAVAAFILHRTPGRNEGVDALGAGVLAVALFSLALAFSQAPEWGWASPVTLGLFLFATVAIVVFIGIEARVKAPTLDLALFRIRVFTMSTLAATAYFIALSAIVFTIPLAAQLGDGYDSLSAALTLLPIFIFNIVLAPTAGALSDKIPIRILATIGATIFAIGIGTLALVGFHPFSHATIFAMVFAGIGTTIFSQPNNNAIMSAAPAQWRGVAAGTLATARTAGQLLGTALAGGLYYAVGAHGIFVAVALLMAVVAFVSFTRD
ncbi:MAG: DHA2 family efflux MFS transporter permease subunit [Vulcanimicrobiaceae bacterium]